MSVSRERLRPEVDNTDAVSEILKRASVAHRYNGLKIKESLRRDCGSLDCCWGIWSSQQVNTFTFPD